MKTALTFLCASLAVLTLGGSLFAHLGHQHTPVVLELKASEDPLPLLLGMGVLGLAFALFRKQMGQMSTSRTTTIVLGVLITCSLGLWSTANFLSRPLPTIEWPEWELETATVGDSIPLAQKHFEPFKDKLQLRSTKDYLFVGSNAFPDHPMMIGITAWQQQVPLPQPYTKTNSWRIPLHPKLADKPISAKKALFSGAIALAVNGVPIFNALNNRGEDAYLAGELDDYGGHCGRGDDYHYHAAPVHLEKVVGKGNPIGYALDGYPLFGFTDAKGNPPSDLDEFNGRMENGSYRYYSTKTFPYINGGLRGEITVRGDRVDPQPKDRPVRMARQPLKDAKITDFVRDEARKTYTVKYDIRGAEHLVQYTIKKDGTYSFTYQDNLGVKTTQEYKQQDKSAGKWEKGKEGKEDKGKKEGKKEGKGPGGKAGDL